MSLQCYTVFSPNIDILFKPIEQNIKTKIPSYSPPAGGSCVNDLGVRLCPRLLSLSAALLFRVLFTMLSVTY